MGTSAALGTDAAANEAGAQLARLIAEQEAEFFSRQTRSAEMHERAVEHLAGGATSNWMISRPRRSGCRTARGRPIYDVDGNEYVDLHAGYGAMLVGHAHPAMVEAVERRVRLGTTSRSPPRTRSSWPRSWAAASGCRSGASRTRAPRRPWTPST